MSNKSTSLSTKLWPSIKKKSNYVKMMWKGRSPKSRSFVKLCQMSMTGLEDPIREQNVVCQRRSKCLTSNNLTERMIYCYVGTRE